MNNKIKQAIRNAFIYINDNNIEFTPETFFQAICAESKNLGLNFEDCNWFNIWSSKFDDFIKEEINNYPIKNRNDFINTLSHIYNKRLRECSPDTFRILQKAINFLNKNNLTNFDSKTPLNIMDLELSKLLMENSNSIPKIESNIESSVDSKESDKIPTKLSDDTIESINSFVKQTKLLNEDELKNIINKLNFETNILICEIMYFEKIKLEYGNEASERLFKAFYNILIKNILPNDIIGIYNESSIMIITKDTTQNSVLKYLETFRNTINSSVFMYKDKQVRINTQFQVKQIKDLI